MRLELLVWEICDADRCHSTSHLRDKSISLNTCRDSPILRGRCGAGMAVSQSFHGECRVCSSVGGVHIRPYKIDDINL